MDFPLGYPYDWHKCSAHELFGARGMQTCAPGGHAMKPLLRDVFSDTVEKVKELGMWEKLTVGQKETLVRKCILEHYNKKRDHVKAAAAAKY